MDYDQPLKQRHPPSCQRDDGYGDHNNHTISQSHDRLNPHVLT